MPEYVDMTEYDEMPSEDQQPAKPPYVNVPIDPTASPNRQPLPKPRATRGWCPGGPGGTLPEEGGLHSRLSESSHSPHQPRGTSSTSSSSSCRGKRPVPLPRRVSSLPTAPQTVQQGGAPRMSTPGPLPTASPSKSSSSTAPSCPRGAVSGGAGARSNTSSQRRRCTTEIPTPTANYKSYRRVLPPEVSRRSSGVEAGSGSVRHRIGAPPAPALPPSSSPTQTAPVTKSRSMTRLTLDTAAPISVRTPPRLTEPPARHSSISSCDSGHGSFPTSPLRLQPGVRNGAKPGPDFIRRQSSSASSTASQQSVEERRNRRRSAVLREETEREN